MTHQLFQTRVQQGEGGQAVAGRSTATEAQSQSNLEVLFLRMTSEPRKTLESVFYVTSTWTVKNVEI